VGGNVYTIAGVAVVGGGVATVGGRITWLSKSDFARRAQHWLKFLTKEPQRFQWPASATTAKTHSVVFQIVPESVAWQAAVLVGDFETILERHAYVFRHGSRSLSGNSDRGR